MTDSTIASDPRAWRLATALAGFGRVLLAIPLVGGVAWLLAATVSVTGAVIVVTAYGVVVLLMLLRFWGALFRYTVDRRGELMTRRSFSEQFAVLRCAGRLLLHPRRASS